MLRAEFERARNMAESITFKGIPLIFDPTCPPTQIRMIGPGEVIVWGGRRGSGKSMRIDSFTEFHKKLLRHAALYGVVSYDAETGVPTGGARQADHHARRGLPMSRWPELQVPDGL